MANVKVAMSKKGMLIALVIGVLLLGGGGGYLLWRVNQQDTVAPTDSDASSCVKCYNKDGTWPVTCTRCEAGYELKDGECCLKGGGIGACEAEPDGWVSDCPYKYTSIAGDCYTFACGKYSFKYSCGKDVCYDYTLTYKAGTMVNGAFVPSSVGGTVNDKDEVVATHVFYLSNGPEVTASPKAGYKFLKWSDNSTNPVRKDTSVTGNINANAIFEKEEDPAPATYTLTASVKPSESGGSVVYRLENETLDKNKAIGVGVTVTQGLSYIITANVPEGYKFDKWTKKYPGKAEEPVITDSLKNPTTRGFDQDITFIANFEKVSTTDPVEQYTLSAIAKPEEAGKVLHNGTDMTNKSALLNAGSSYSLSAVANTGYKFVKWTKKYPPSDTEEKVEEFETDANITRNIDKDIILIANFSPSSSNTCGDGVCSPGETPATCPADCGSGGSICGDGVCSSDESSATCPVDCGGGGTGGGSGTGGGGTVPNTAIFEDTKDTIIFGIVVLMIGIGWTWLSTLPKRAYSSISKVSADTKAAREKETRESRRNRLERKLK